ncbi:uncharacterized protein CANTADRAFT_53590 [Suhomyces tanzawaensis NRRL Y-17324]|uniref:INSIG-domain-containing protein n=1 Tax=Suhomyces tanzawaensis NRRL Y-17324 TaxID=984487 RepID=A0A1E4SFY4_9ASCO|nr:uncharacterized protein CANTADRAFT_53590 [Suhomyces tanzawaensis NRRL Y-17324]ODV78424.1 hypothetical protein CANTADRAFT_53590 [Suhomyces tanzawaensis NRRL Y-17324]
MEDLRKRAFSNTNLKRLDSTPVSVHGSSTSVNSMQKTDSVLNLTKPSLYGIYREDSYLNLSTGAGADDLAIEIPASKDRRPSETAAAVTISHHTKVPIPIKVAVLAGCAFIYNEITKHLHYNHLGSNGLSNVPVSVTNAIIFSIFEKLKVGSYITLDHLWAKRADAIFALTVQGMCMALVHPILDAVLPSKLSVRLLSSNPNPNQQRSYSNLFNDLLRASITFLGISYATRKIEWASFLQVSIIWSLLNPGLWLLLDGTISGLLASLAASTVACASVYFENYSFIKHYASTQYDDSIALCLWIGSFFFCGIIIFGKIGRGLFGCK